MLEIVLLNSYDENCIKGGHSIYFSIFALHLPKVSKHINNINIPACRLCVNMICLNNRVDVGDGFFNFEYNACIKLPFFV